MSKVSRANSFDAVRLCAAIAVLVTHAFVVLRRPTPSFGAVSIGDPAVPIFFGISGYLITQSWVANPDLRGFALKRVLRIYPAVISVALLTVFVLGPLVTTVPLHDYFTSGETWHYLAMNALSFHIMFTLPGVFAHNPWHLVNRSLWTLPGELLGYLSVAALGVVGAYRNRWLALAGLLVVAAFAGHIPGTISVVEGWWLRAFAVGSGLFLFRDLIPRRLWIGALLVAAVLLCGEGHAYALQSCLSSLAFPYAAVVIAHRFPNLLKPITRHGDFSYGAYAYGWPVEQLLVLWLGRSASVAVLLPLAFVATMSLAVTSWFVIERPALRLKRRVGRRPAVAAAGAPATAAAQPTAEVVLEGPALTDLGLVAAPPTIGS